MRKKHLLAPGPTPVPPEALNIMSKPIIHHRTSEYRNYFAEVREGLRYVFKTDNEVLVFASSGTGAMEGAVVNLLSSGDKVLVVRGGKFGERFGEIAAAYGSNIIPLDVTWGEAVSPTAIEQILKKDKEIKAVFTTLCETSTGVANDISAIGSIVNNYSAVLVVDAISGLGAMPLETDSWNVDVVVGGSQKGLMIPPGLSFICLSEKARAMVEKAALPRYYFDFRKAMKAQESSDSAFTPAITLVLALREALKLIREEGLDNILTRHALLADATRAAVKGMNLELFAPASPANAVTAVKVPEGMDGAALVKILREKYGITVAGGQAHLKGKIFRIAHLGYTDINDITMVIAAVEIVLSRLGYKLELGAGVRAAQKVFLKE